MIKDIEVEIKIYSQNRKKYEEILKKKLKNGEVLAVNQRNVLKTSRLEVECICDICDKDFMRRRVDIKSETTTCSTRCRNEYLRNNNPNPRKDKILVGCQTCQTEICVSESKYNSQERFFCSKQCYYNFRSEYYKGDMIYNYNSLDANCDNCNESIIVSKFSHERNRNVFCSPSCYYEFRSDNYVELYYVPHLRDSFSETKPERLVREWLEDRGIKHKSEAGFLGKYYCDFYLYEFKIVLEVYGDYWHVNPEVYNVDGRDCSKKELNAQQLEFVKNDEERENDFISRGIDYRVIWEKQVHEDLDHHMHELLSDKIESVTTGRNAPSGKKVQSEHTHII